MAKTTRKKGGTQEALRQAELERFARGQEARKEAVRKQMEAAAAATAPAGGGGGGGGSGVENSAIAAQRELLEKIKGVQARNRANRELVE